MNDCENIQNENFHNLQILEKHEEKVWCVSWHPIDNIFASCGSDKKIIIWEGNENGNYSPQAILDESHSRTIRSIAWDFSGNFLASASFDSNNS